MGGDGEQAMGWSWVEPRTVAHAITLTPREWQVVVACHGPTSLAQLVARTGLSMVEVLAVVDELVAQSLVSVDGAASAASAPSLVGAAHAPLFSPARAAAPASPLAFEPDALELGADPVAPARTFTASDPRTALAPAVPIREAVAPTSMPAAPLVFAPPAGADASPIDLAPISRATPPSSPATAPPLPGPVLEPLGRQRPPRPEGTAPPAVRPPRSASLAAEAPASGPKSSSFERRLAKLERRAQRADDGTDHDPTVDDRGDGDGEVAESATVPVRQGRDTSSVVLRMVRSFNENRG